jgi:hypothetical protein
LVSHNEEGHRLWVFVNRVQRKIYGLKMGVITGEWRRLHNKGLYDLYSSVIQVIKPRMRWAEHVACMGGGRVYRGLVGKPEGKTPLGRPRHRWDNIKMDLQQVGLVGWTGLT